MKSILKSLLKSPDNKPDALAWVKDLAHLDDVQALKASTEQLGALISSPQTTTEMLYKVALVADQENRARLSTIHQQFIQFDFLREELALKLANTVFFYFRQLSACYRKLILEFLQSKDSAPPFPSSQLSLMIGRAICSNISMTKWRHYQQLPAIDSAWQELHALYSLAESEGFANASIQIYRDEAEVYLTGLYISTCMMGALDHATMTKYEVEIVADLLKVWEKSLKLSNHYHPKKHLFYVDLASDAPAKRIRLLDEYESNRYWEIDFINAKIELGIFHAENNQLDKFNEIQHVSKYPQLLSLLQMLKSEWSRHDYQRQRRTEERKPVMKSAVLTYGIDHIAKKFKLHNLNISRQNISENSLENRLMHGRSPSKHAPNVLFEDSMLTKWMIQNESKSGFGMTIADTTLPNEVKLGKLVGINIDGDKSNMVLATIKSIKNLNNQYQVGLKVISKQASIAEAFVIASPNSASHQGFSDLNPPFFGLYIGEEDGLSMWPSVIFPKLQFQENAIYQIIVFHEKHSVRLGKPIEARDDWVRVNWPE